MRKTRTIILLLSAVLAAWLLEAGPAVAAFPGANGRISFVSDRDPLGTGNTQLFVMGAGGENPTNVSTNPDNDENPSFSPDGTRIAFSGDPDIGNDELYVMNADGTHRVRLTRTASDETDPVFSPDGRRIAFVSFSNGSLGSEIDLIDAGGGNRVRLLYPTGKDFVSYSDPSWSPDGTRIAFTREGGGQTDVWVIDLASGVQTRLTSGPELNSEPDWSPDGTRIAYVSDPYVFTATALHSNPDIWTMGADGGGKARLTTDSRAETNPAFSPDGSQIAFTDRRAQSDLHSIVSYPGDVYVMNADGTRQRDLTAGATTGFYNDEKADDEDPSWQPLQPGARQAAPAFSGMIAVPGVLSIRSRSTRPVISSARRRGRGAIRFHLSKRGSAKLAVERVRRGRKAKRGRCVPTRRPVGRRKRCLLAKLQGWIVRPAKRGRNRVLFTGRVARKPLKAGLYRIRAGAVDRKGNPARQKWSRTFRVVR